jgi:Ni/Fe-hydrogenase subunit HybB-like protein
MEAGSGTYYLPKWTEIMITLSIIALGFAVFRFAAKHLPIFSPDGSATARLDIPAVPTPGLVREG